MILRYDRGMNTHHEPIGPNHPAVEALARELAQLDAGDPWPSNDDLGGHHILGTRDDEYRFAMLEEARAVLNTVLPHLTADDLRDTPAVADLIAERDTYREFAFEVDGLQRALEDGELDLRHCDTRLVPTEEVMDWLGQLIKRMRSGLIHQEGDA